MLQAKIFLIKNSTKKLYLKTPSLVQCSVKILVQVKLRSDHASHMLKHNIETSHDDVNTGNFKINDMNFSNNKSK